MNERIRELWTSVCQNEMPELDETCMTLSRQRKFAELIVQECALYVDTLLGDADNEVYPDGEMLLEYFGVE